MNVLPEIAVLPRFNESGFVVSPIVIAKNCEDPRIVLPQDTPQFGEAALETLRQKIPVGAFPESIGVAVREEIAAEKDGVWTVGSYRSKELVVAI